MRSLSSVLTPALLAASLAALPVRADDGLVPRIEASVGAQICTAPCPQMQAAPGEVVLLDGAASTDGDAGVASYLWELVEQPLGATAELGAPVTAASSSLAPDLPGEYRVALTVTGAGGTPRRAELLLHVSPTAFRLRLALETNGRAVHCDPRCDDYVINIGTLVTADVASSTHDAARGGLAYFWTLVTPDGSGTALHAEDATNTRYTFRPDVDGAYEVRVVMKDSLDSATAWSSFYIPTPLNVEPLDLSEYGCSASSPSSLAPVALLALLLARRRR